jgi:hypothetical protein
VFEDFNWKLVVGVYAIVGLAAGGITVYRQVRSKRIEKE